MLGVVRSLVGVDPLPTKLRHQQLLHPGDLLSQLGVLLLQMLAREHREASLVKNIRDIDKSSGHVWDIALSQAALRSSKQMPGKIFVWLEDPLDETGCCLDNRTPGACVIAQMCVTFIGVVNDKGDIWTFALAA